MHLYPFGMDFRHRGFLSSIFLHGFGVHASNQKIYKDTKFNMDLDVTIST